MSAVTFPNNYKYIRLILEKYPVYNRDVLNVLRFLIKPKFKDPVAVNYIIKTKKPGYIDVLNLFENNGSLSFKDFKLNSQLKKACINTESLVSMEEFTDEDDLVLIWNDLTLNGKNNYCLIRNEVLDSIYADISDSEHLSFRTDIGMGAPLLVGKIPLAKEEGGNVVYKIYVPHLVYVDSSVFLLNNENIVQFRLEPVSSEEIQIGTMQTRPVMRILYRLIPMKYGQQMVNMYTDAYRSFGRGRKRF